MKYNPTKQLATKYQENAASAPVEFLCLWQPVPNDTQQIDKACFNTSVLDKTQIKVKI